MLAIGCFLNNSSKAHVRQLANLMILRTLLRSGHLPFTWKTQCGLKFNFGQFDGSEIYTEVGFTMPEVM